MKPLGTFIKGLRLHFHQYVDDLQLYLRIPSNPRKVMEELGHDLEKVRNWMRLNKPRVNLDKTEVVLVGPDLTMGSDCDMMLEGVVLPPKDQVRSLGVLLDLVLLLDKQVVALASWGCVAFPLLRLVHQLCPFLEKRDLAMVTLALVTARLNYYHVLYVGLPVGSIM